MTQHDRNDTQSAEKASRPDSSPDSLVVRRDLEAGRRVLDAEASAVNALSEGLGTDFSAAVTLLAGVEGRVIVTGMGKSGHIAHKIAASLASTGTPAQFVHPAEASHGDLGMVTRKDAILALSNSGNTVELADIIGFSRRFSIPLVAMTARAGSQLAEASDAQLILAEVPEACPMGLAPTTSTTMMLAMGDALAVALLERKGFSVDDFRNLHPGGALGQRLLKVQDIMHGQEEVPLCDAATAMADAILTMTNRRFGCVGVTGDAGQLIGIVTDGDLRRHMSKELLAMTAGEVMNSAPKTVRPQALAAEALGQMNTLSITSLFVVADIRPIGIVHIHDCLRAGV